MTCSSEGQTLRTPRRRAGRGNGRAQTTSTIRGAGVGVSPRARNFHRDLTGFEAGSVTAGSPERSRRQRHVGYGRNETAGSAGSGPHDLKRGALLEQLGADHLLASVEEAVAALKRRTWATRSGPRSVVHLSSLWAEGVSLTVALSES